MTPIVRPVTSCHASTRAGRSAQDRRQRVGAGLGVCAAAQVVVDDVDVVAALREPHRGGPAQVSVTAQDEDAHVRTSLRSGERSRWYPVPGCITSQGRPGPPGPYRPPRRVVVAKAYAYGAAGLEQAEPLEHLDRVVVPVPGEDAALAEPPGRLDRVLVAERARRRSACARAPGAGSAMPIRRTPGIVATPSRNRARERCVRGPRTRRTRDGSPSRRSPPPPTSAM